jgi:hypothetical protein
MGIQYFSSCGANRIPLVFIQSRVAPERKPSVAQVVHAVNQSLVFTKYLTGLSAESFVESTAEIHLQARPK